MNSLVKLKISDRKQVPNGAKGAVHSQLKISDISK